MDVKQEIKQKKTFFALQKEWMSRKHGKIARNKHVLKRPEKFSLIPPEYDGDWSLKIVNIQLDDEDSYHCTAGFYRTRVRLTVEGIIKKNKNNPYQYMGLFVRKAAFGVTDQVRHKPGCTATEDG